MIPSLLRVSTQNVHVCTFKTFSCMLATGAHVGTHVRVLPAYTGTFGTYTRGRVEWTHGVFQRVHHTRTHTHTTTTTTATTTHTTDTTTDTTCALPHTTQHATSHGDRETERKTERDRVRRQERREKMKEKLNLCLLNRVKHDSSLISFSASWRVNSFLISANCLIHAVAVSNFFRIIQLCSYSFFCRN